MLTLGREGGARGDGEGEAGPAEFCAGLDPLLLLLFWSSGRSVAGGGPVWAGGDTLTPLSAFAVVSLGVSIETGGDERREPEFRASLSAAPAATCLSQGSTLPFAEWKLSISPKIQSGW